MNITREIDYVFRFSHGDDNVPAPLLNPVARKFRVNRRSLKVSPPNVGAIRLPGRA